MDELLEGDLVYYIGPASELLGLSDGVIGVVTNPRHGNMDWTTRLACAGIAQVLDMEKV